MRLFPRLASRLAIVAMLATSACGDSGDQSPTGTTNPSVQNVVTLGNNSVNVTFAATCATREKGLMGVTNLDAQSGMLFVFADDRQRAFWMKDTPTPLSIAFLDASKKIVFMADMPPNSTTIFGGLNAPQMRYALEVNQGWFASHAVTMGMTASFTLPSGLTIEPDCP